MKTVKTMPPADREVKKLEKIRKSNQAWFADFQDKAAFSVPVLGLPKGKGL